MTKTSKYLQKVGRIQNEPRGLQFKEIFINLSNEVEFFMHSSLLRLFSLLPTPFSYIASGKG